MKSPVVNMLVKEGPAATELLKRFAHPLCPAPVTKRMIRLIIEAGPATTTDDLWESFKDFLDAHVKCDIITEDDRQSILAGCTPLSAKGLN